MKEAILSIVSKNILKLLTVLVFCSAFLYILSPFFIPIILGGILAMAFSDFVKKIMSHGFSRTKSINIITIGMFFIGLIPSVIFFIRGASLFSNVISQSDSMNQILDLKNKALGIIDQIASRFNFSSAELNQHLETVIKNIGSFLLNMFSNFLAQIPDLILITLITFLAFYFFLINEESIRKTFDRYFYLSQKASDDFVRVLKSSCREVFFSNVLTGIIQSVIVTLGAIVFNAGDAFIIFFLTFICSFIPVLGAGPVAFVLSLISFASGSTGAGIGLLVISIFSGLADNIIRPYLASMGDVAVDGFISFLAVIGGVIVLGLPGLFVGPLLASLVFGAVPIIIKEYFPPKDDIKAFESPDEVKTDSI